MKTLRKIFVIAMSLMMLLTMMPMATGVAFADDIALATSINAQAAELGDIPKVEVKTSNSQLVLDGYEVFRSTKRYSGYGTTCFFDTKNLTYNNTKVDIGKRYFYKVRGYVLVDGERYYTPFSTKAYRKVLSTAKNKLSAVRKNKAYDATMQVTGEDLAKALDKVKFKANSKLVKRTNGMPAISLNWTADTSGHTLSDVNAAVNKTPAWHYYGGGGSPATPPHTHSYASEYYALNESTGDMTLVCDSCHEARTPLTTFTGNYFAVKQSNEYYKVYELASSSNLTNLGVTVSGTDVTYVNSETSRDVVIRTNSNLTVLNVTDNSENGVVKHYGKAGFVNVLKTGVHSYHECGETSYLAVTDGHIVVENESVINELHFVATGTAFAENIVLTFEDVNNLPAFSRDKVTIPTTGDKSIKVCTVEVREAKDDIYLYANGLFEQIKVTNTSGTKFADDSNVDRNTQIVARAIANLWTGSAPVTFENEETRTLLAEDVEKVKDDIAVLSSDTLTFTKVTTESSNDSYKGDLKESITLNGSGTESDPYLVSYAAELFTALQSTANATIYIDIVSDIYLGSWYPTYVTNDLIIKGNGHTLYGMRVYSTLGAKKDKYQYAAHSGYYAGLIGFAGTGIDINMSNVTFENCFVSPNSILSNLDASTDNGWSIVGLIVGKAYSQLIFNNVHINNCTVEADTKNAIFCGNYTPQNANDYIRFYNCSIENSSVVGNYNFGLVAGLTTGNNIKGSCELINNELTIGRVLSDFTEYLDANNNIINKETELEKATYVYLSNRFWALYGTCYTYQTNDTNLVPFEEYKSYSRSQGDQFRVQVNELPPIDD